MRRSLVLDKQKRFHLSSELAEIVRYCQVVPIGNVMKYYFNLLIN